MKNIFLSVLLFGSLGVKAQERSVIDVRLNELRNEKNNATLQKKIKSLENGSAEDLHVLIQYYNKDTAKKNTVTRKLLKKYPNNDFAGLLRLTSFLKLSESQMDTLLQSMIREYPGVNLDKEKYVVGGGYASLDSVTKAHEIVNTIEDPAFRLVALTEIIQTIADFSNTRALALATEELRQAAMLKDQTIAGTMKLDNKKVYYDYINLYGKLLLKAGKMEDAYKYTTEAYTNIKQKDAGLVENYAYLSSLHGNYEQALPVLVRVVKEGKNDPGYIEQIRKGYSKLNPGKNVEEYIATLQKDFTEKIRAHVVKLLIDETPPDFYIKDVNGKKVTLADFKGKTIVLDFWATWCGPCVESFPAMQMAVNRYKDDPAVKFLFIHTAEHVPDPLTDAKNFLAKRNYDFDLYMDTKDPVLQAPPALKAFKIDGIPMKYVIDANGKIRFKVSGFSGKNETAAEEVAQMIELARKGA